jgi:hypothetical protein
VLETSSEIASKRYKTKKGENNAYIMTKEEVVESSFDMDEAIVCTTLQQLRVSEDKNSLFQINVQVNNWKVNASFDNGSRYNMIYKTLVDELHLETYNLV